MSHHLVRQLCERCLKFPLMGDLWIDVTHNLADCFVLGVRVLAQLVDHQFLVRVLSRITAREDRLRHGTPCRLFFSPPVLAVHMSDLLLGAQRRHPVPFTLHG